jgi:trigger factor
MSGLGMEVYLKSIKKTEQELREELRPAATRNVTGSLVLGRIAEAEKIEISDAEINTEIDTMVGSAVEDKRDELRKILTQSLDSIHRSLLARKTIDLLATIARGPEVTEVKEEKNE